MSAPASPDRRPPPPDDDPDLMRRTADRDRRRAEQRNVDPAKKLQAEGYREDEVQFVLNIWKKREEWRGYGKEIEVLFSTEWAKWTARYMALQLSEYMALPGSEEFVKEHGLPKEYGKPADRFRAVRAVAGSTLENEKAEVKVNFFEEFDLPGEFSVEHKFMPYIEGLIQAKLKERSAPEVNIR